MGYVGCITHFYRYHRTCANHGLSLKTGQGITCFCNPLADRVKAPETVTLLSAVSRWGEMAFITTLWRNIQQNLLGPACTPTAVQPEIQSLLFQD